MSLIHNIQNLLFYLIFLIHTIGFSQENKNRVHSIISYTFYEKENKLESIILNSKASFAKTSESPTKRALGTLSKNFQFEGEDFTPNNSEYPNKYLFIEYNENFINKLKCLKNKDWIEMLENESTQYETVLILNNLLEIHLYKKYRFIKSRKSWETYKNKKIEIKSLVDKLNKFKRIKISSISEQIKIRNRGYHPVVFDIWKSQKRFSLI